MSHNPPNIIVITGASSGLGKALALAYAGPTQTLHIFGRNQINLEGTAQQIRDKGGIAINHVIDVTEREELKKILQSIDQETPIELIIANAGISAGTGTATETAGQCRAIFDTNINGVLNTVLPILPLMQQRRSGQIAIVSSIASFRGMPGAPAYCASKAAVRTWGEALRGEYAANNVKINVICPGFVKTPMTDVNTFPMPFLISAERAAKIIKRSLSRNVGRISFPWPMAFASWWLHALPDAWVNTVTKLLPKKP